MAKWSRDSTVVLIELYQQHTCLYDTKDKEYHNRLKREKILQDICWQLIHLRGGTTVADIKAKVKTLRSQYSSENVLIKKSKRSGAGTYSIYTPKLWCFDSLRFLETYTKEREGESNIEESNNNTSTESVMLESPSQETDIATTPSTATSSASNMPVRKKGTKRKNEELVEEAQGALQLAKQLAAKHSGKSKEDVFAAFVASELKQIGDVQIYNETKWRIQTALMEGIKKQMQATTPAASSSTSSTSSNLILEDITFINYSDDSLS